MRSWEKKARKNRKIAAALAARRLGINADAITESLEIIPFIAFAVNPNPGKPE